MGYYNTYIGTLLAPATASSQKLLTNIPNTCLIVVGTRNYNIIIV